MLNISCYLLTLFQLKLKTGAFVFMPWHGFHVTFFIPDFKEKISQRKFVQFLIPNRNSSTV